MLFGGAGHDDLVVRSARVIDPTRGIDELLDVRVDGGVISQIGLNVDANGHRVVEGRGLVLAPGVRRPARPSAHAGPRGRGDDRERDGCGRRRRLLRDPGDAEHGAGRRLARRCSAP